MLTQQPAADPGRAPSWTGRDRFVVLDTGFGNGQRFLDTWACWRADPQRCQRLHYIAIDAHPPSVDQLASLPRDPDSAGLVAQLVEAWPALTPNLHRLDFEAGRVQLLLLIDALGNGLRELVAEVDEFRLEQSSAAPDDPDWPRLAKRLARLAAPRATLTGGAADPALLQGLRAAGFDIDAPAGGVGAAGNTRATFAPRFAAQRPPARQPPAGAVERSPTNAAAATGAGPRDALIVGAGLAGCATAAALVEQGWTVTLIDRHAAPAREASGNVAGVFHGVVHARDGHHARFNRAAALSAARVFRSLLAAADLLGNTPHRRAGSVDGLLRLGSKLSDAASMQRLLAELRLPPGFVQAVDADHASRLAGVPLHDAAWFYPTGGWMRPGWLADQWLQQAGAACRFIGGTEVESIQRQAGRWLVSDRHGKTIAEATQLVLANANDARRLLDGLAGRPLAWPLQTMRGQTSGVDLGELDGAAAPLLPLSGAGYVLPVIDSALWFGATAQAEDACAAVRASDHRQNAVRLASLSASFEAIQQLPDSAFSGRTAWRCVSDDRLPLLGAVPQAWAGGPGGDWDQPRRVPRQAGLYMFTALGSRGITWAPLGAAVLAALISGAPIPLEASLLDAVDPARFLTRANRRQAASRQAGRA